MANEHVLLVGQGQIRAYPQAWDYTSQGRASSGTDPGDGVLVSPASDTGFVTILSHGPTDTGWGVTTPPLPPSAEPIFHPYNASQLRPKNQYPNIYIPEGVAFSGAHTLERLYVAANLGYNPLVGAVVDDALRWCRWRMQMDVGGGWVNVAGFSWCLPMSNLGFYIGPNEASVPSTSIPSGYSAPKYSSFQNALPHAVSFTRLMIWPLNTSGVAIATTNKWRIQMGSTQYGVGFEYDVWAVFKKT